MPRRGMPAHAPGRLHTQSCEQRVLFGAQIILPLLTALAYMHDKGFIHRDVQPSKARLSSYAAAAACAQLRWVLS